MNDETKVTKSDLAEQNFNKVYPEGFASDRPDEQVLVRRDLVPAATGGQLIARPDIGINAAELDVAKTMAMITGFIPEFYFKDVARCWAVLQLSKRWTRFDKQTNSWIHIDPLYIASQTYLVESNDGRRTVGYSSQFIGTVLDDFVPWAEKMRFTYSGEGQERTCTATAKLRSDPTPFEYTTPPLKTITPKRSPLWQSDPDRQLAYYARRAWARLFAAGVLGGVYDPDELEGSITVGGAHRVRDLSDVEGLSQRLKAAAANGPSEGLREGIVEQGLERERPATEQKRPQKRLKRGEGTQTAPKRQKAVSAAPRARAAQDAKPKGKPRREVAKRREERARPPADLPTPKTPKEYFAHVTRWLTTLETEEAIEAKWRSEMKLRNHIGVVEEERNECRIEIERRIQELRE